MKEQYFWSLENNWKEWLNWEHYFDYCFKKTLCLPLYSDNVCYNSYWDVTAILWCADMATAFTVDCLFKTENTTFWRSWDYTDLD